MGKWIRRILIVVLLGVFVFSTWKLLSIRQRYKTSQAVYNDAVAQFTKPAARPAEAGTAAADTPGEPAEESAAPETEYAPIEVNFEFLTEINGDVIGWIYCEDTVINYPVVHAPDNEHYLERDYRNNPDPCGTIFMDMSNTRGFNDSNVILYGHHMQDMTMFATLKYWLEQDYYDAHPVMWLLTPEQDYRIELFSGYVTSAISDTYTIFYGPRPEFDDYLQTALSQSEFRADVELDGESHYVVLSTCTYSFELARTVLHGKLVPVNSAGGVPFPETA